MLILVRGGGVLGFPKHDSGSVRYDRTNCTYVHFLVFVVIGAKHRVAANCGTMTTVTTTNRQPAQTANQNSYCHTHDDEKAHESVRPWQQRRRQNECGDPWAPKSRITRSDTWLPRTRRIHFHDRASGRTQEIADPRRESVRRRTVVCVQLLE